MLLLWLTSLFLTDHLESGGSGSLSGSAGLGGSCSDPESSLGLRAAAKENLELETRDRLKWQVKNSWCHKSSNVGLATLTNKVKMLNLKPGAKITSKAKGNN